MSDLVERLRNWTEVYPEEAGEAEGSLYGKAADEIERLRAALRGVIRVADRDTAEFIEARAALEGKDD